MNVINFSGGGPQTDPANDAMYEAVHNTALAGVVPVIAAGNDREDFGLGTAGSPGTAPDAITVAATSNSHVFAPALTVTGGPPSLGAVPIQTAGGAALPGAWSTADQTVVDVSTVLGTDGKPVDAHLCGAAGDPNTTLGTLPNGLAQGQDRPRLARQLLASSRRPSARGSAGATGMILIDNRFGEANPIPMPMPLPAGMISDLDGQQPARVRRRERRRRRRFASSSNIEEIPTDRSGVITSFSSAGPDRLRAHAEAGHLGARARRALVDAAEDDRLDVLGLRRHVDGDAPRRRRGRAAAAAASRLGAVAGQVGADGRRPAPPGATPPARRRHRCCSRARGSPTS